METNFFMITGDVLGKIVVEAVSLGEAIDRYNAYVDLEYEKTRKLMIEEGEEDPGEFPSDEWLASSAQSVNFDVLLYEDED